VGFLAFIEVVIFVLILFLGLIYMWTPGDLKWTKEVPEELEEGVILEEEKPIVF
jgi:nitrate reductase gamma subunit